MRPNFLGALRLLRGDTAGSDRIGPHRDEARVEGRFTIGGDEVVVARRVTASTSRAYADGSMVPAKALTERLDSLVEIVAQHEHVSLGREASLRRIVDGALDADGRSALADYRAAWERLRTLRADREALGGDARALARDLDVARHEATEIASARLQPGEDEALRSTLARVRHGAEIAEDLGEAATALGDDGSASDLLRQALARARSAADLDDTLQPLAERLGSLVVEIDDLAGELRDAAESVDHDPDALRRMESRASLLADVKRKYGATVEEVIAYGERSAERAAHLETLAERAATIDDDVAAAEQAALDAGETLAGSRRAAGDRLAEAALVLLRQLGFRDPILSIDVADGPPAASGADSVQLSFSSGAGLAPGPVARVASGGELSRLVLSVRVAAGVADADVVAFDEIDAGVGGTTALAMGELLARLARGRQVLVVTHLPQIAAFADAHFVVERDERAAVVRRVDGADRLAELARMLSGIEDSERGQQHADELLALAAERKAGE